MNKRKPKPKNLAAVALGRLSGAKLTPDERRERARKAAQARWGKVKVWEKLRE